MASALYPAASIAGQTVLITGASAGIGEACAWRFAEAACRLVLIARREDRLSALQQQLAEKFQTEVHCVTADVRDTDALMQHVQQLPPPFDNIDILVNNAGLALGVAAIHENNLEDVRTMLETNVMAVFALTKVVAAQMVARGRGHIINISSVAGHESYGGGSAYCATKFALDAMTTAARHDLVGTPIRVTAISPGAVKTEFSKVRFYGDESKADAVYDGIIPLNANDIADNVLYAVTRPAHVQIAEITVLATLQSSAKSLARVLKTN